MSFSAMFPALCRVARETVLPEINTGSSSATGVAAPVRPTCTVIALRRVRARSARYFHATAQRGACDVIPAAACSEQSSSLTTAPSVLYGKSARTSSSSQMRSNAPLGPSPSSVHENDGNPHPRRIPASSDCLLSSKPSTAPSE